MNLVKKLLLPLTIIVMLAGCASEAEKEKNDAKIFESKLENYENSKLDNLFGMIEKYENMDKEEAVKELNKEIENMTKEQIKLIDKDFDDIKSKIGKELVNLIKEITIKEFELQKEYVIRVIDNNDPNNFLSSLNSPTWDELEKLFDKLDMINWIAYQKNLKTELTKVILLNENFCNNINYFSYCKLCKTYSFQYTK